MQSLLKASLPLEKKNKSYWDNVQSSAVPMAIAQAIKNHDGFILVIAESSLQTQQLEESVHFFSESTKPLSFPSWETLPYDQFSPHQDIISERLSTLYKLPHVTKGLLVLPIEAVLQKLIPKDYVLKNSLVIHKGDEFSIETMSTQLVQSGYHKVTQVMEHGEYATRGAIFDIFPMGSTKPYRIDLFDNEIESIRIFDPDTQRTIENIDKINLLPAHECPMGEEEIKIFRQHWRARFTGNPATHAVYDAISNKIACGGIEYYLPLFFETTNSLFDYLPDNTLIIKLPNLQTAGDKIWESYQSRYTQLAYDVTRPLLEPNELIFNLNNLFEYTNKYNQLNLSDTPKPQKKNQFNFKTDKLPNLLVDHHQSDPISRLRNFCGKFNGNILITSESDGRRELLLEFLVKNNLNISLTSHWSDFIKTKNKINLTTAPLYMGFILGDDKPIAIIPETEIYGKQVYQRRKRQSKVINPDTIIQNLAELSINAPVVHLEHGIGRYLGLIMLTISGRKGEFLHLEYADGDKLYVPVSSLHLINRYTGCDAEHAPLHRLGTDKWTKEKAKAAEKARDVAAELLDIYARREARGGNKFTIHKSDYQKFSDEFPFETTIDQEKAIDDVIADMANKKSMDRLICGDVGFGKTEVAMRAAFIAIQNNKQVAILVPTTLLAEQHYQNFIDRFANWPVRIEALSRFVSKKNQQEILEKLNTNKIDIIIGTHRLIQKDIKFANLGLLIIDEEHRFGVNQKEQIKKYRSEVDILALTATPIPRTLNMSLTGVRDLSLIATPPARRLSVKTFIHESNSSLIREAVLREIMRGGQVFYLHNKVETIEKTAHDLAELLPEAKIDIGHGQMSEKQLESVMSDFYHNRINVLVCTTIIETGIDVPTANTIIIDRADRFGLAQLHQLRGRVGRSHHQAYAYLLTPHKKAMSSDSIKRLDAIASLGDLGIGFTLATHDMEIRGAGELLGDEQSGTLQAIGFTLYMELLDRAVQALKENKQLDLLKPLELQSEIDLPIPSLIPEDYVHDVHTRLILYKRISNAQDRNQLDDLRAEFIDRFGELPHPTKNLFLVTQLKLQAIYMGILKIDGNANTVRILFSEQPKINPENIIKLIQLKPKSYKLDGQNKLKVFLDPQSELTLIQSVDKILQELNS